MVERPGNEAKLQLEVAIMGKKHIIVGRAFCDIALGRSKESPLDIHTIYSRTLNPLGAIDLGISPPGHN